MAKRPVRNLLSLIQNRFFTTSTTLPPPPPSSAAQSSTSASKSAIPITESKAAFSNLLKDYRFEDPQIRECTRVARLNAQEAAKPIKKKTKEDKAAEQTSEFFNLFRDYGFEHSQIEKLRKCRYVAKKLSAKILKPKLNCFIENGFTGELLHNLIVSNPYILVGSLNSCIKPRFQFLKQYLDSDKKVVTAITRTPWIFTTGNFNLTFRPNIEFLINEGVPVHRVSYLLLLQPRAFMQSRDRVAYAFKTVRDLGVAPDDPIFIHALRVVFGLSESSLKKKLEFFKSLGWSDVQALSILKTHPTCLGLSEEHLRSKMGFLVDTIKLEPEIVIRNPFLLRCAKEMIRARYEVLKILKSEKLIRGVKISTAVKFSEDRFLQSYVIKHVKSVPGILEMYNAAIARS